MKKLFIIVSVFFCLLISIPSYALTVFDLQNNGKLSIETSLSTSEDVAIGEQVKLLIKIRTDDWFAGGTMISLPQVKDVVILQQKKLAVNFTEKSNGKKWTGQIWELTLYPQKSGEYIIPEIPVNVTIAAGSFRNKVKGTLLTSPQKVTAILPSPKLSEDTLWLSASNFVFSEKNNFEEGKVYEVGDAITREFVYEGSNTLSMLFPVLELSSPDKTKIYGNPIENEDSSTRGDYRSKRIHKFTYIVQESGIVELPDIEMYWWDTNNKVLKKEILSGFKFETKHTLISWLNANKLLLIAMFSFFASLLLIKRKLKSFFVYLWNKDAIRFVRACMIKNNNELNRLNYKKLKQSEGKLSLSSSSSILKNDLSNWQLHYTNRPQKISRLVMMKIRMKLDGAKKKKVKEKEKVLKYL